MKAQHILRGTESVFMYKVFSYQPSKVEYKYFTEIFLSNTHL